MRTKSIFRVFFLLAILIGSFSNPVLASGGNDGPFDSGAAALHHIADAHTYHLFGDYYIPLPAMIFYDCNGGGITFLPSSASFDIGHHGNGNLAIDRYVLMHGVVQRIEDISFPMGEVPINWEDSHAGHDDHAGHNHGPKESKVAADSEGHIYFKGKVYELEHRTTWDGGLAGGGKTSYMDFSITKNVFTLLFVALFFGFIFIRVAAAYRKREGQAPSGLQGFIEPWFLFIQDEVAKPMIGEKHYQRFMPYLMAAFFFILGLNLLGQIPFFPGSGNASGAISVTIAMALFTFVITTINGNRHYWEHILWMPGIPAWVKIIITPVEIMGMFLKPIVLFIRLFANISAGHIVIVAFVGLIFVLGESGKNAVGAGMGVIAAFLLTTFMMALELLVAVLQAYIFTILSASYIGAAVEEHHHEGEAAH